MGWYKISRDRTEKNVYVLDSAADIESLPATGILAGSRAEVFDGSAKWQYSPSAGWVRVTHNYYDEADPVFTASPAAGLTEEDVELVKTNSSVNITADSMTNFINAFNASGLGTITMEYDETTGAYTFTVTAPTEE